MNNPLSPDYVPDKTDGKYPVSIGTSLALETLFGINENIPPTDPLPFTEYSALYVNLRTLVRNLTGAVRKELREEWSNDRIYREIYEELKLLPTVVSEQSHQKLDVYVYFLDYRGIEVKYPNAILKAQKSLTSIKGETLEQYVFSKLRQEQGDRHIPIFRGSITFPVDENNRSIVMTHLPVDLLQFVEKSNVDLIESHTGAIKRKNKWYTKLNNGKELERIPFNNLTIQMFGDGKTFSGLPIAQRRKILDFAKVNRWNQTTSERLMRKQFSRLPDKELAATIKNL